MQTVTVHAYLTTSIGLLAEYPPLSTATIATSVFCGASYNVYENVLVWSNLHLEKGNAYYVTLTNPDQSGPTALWQVGGSDVLSNDGDIVTRNASHDLTANGVEITGGYWGSPNYTYPPSSHDFVSAQVPVIHVNGISTFKLSGRVLYQNHTGTAAKVHVPHQHIASHLTHHSANAAADGTYSIHGLLQNGATFNIHVIANGVLYLVPFTAPLTTATMHGGVVTFDLQLTV